MSDTPVLDRMAAVHEQSQAIGEFLDWLKVRGLTLCRMHVHAEAQCEYLGLTNALGGWQCGMDGNRFYPEHHETEQLLAEFFGVDLAAAERERREVLRRAAAGGRGGHDGV